MSRTGDHDVEGGDTIPAPPGDPLLGTVIDGRYLLLERLGEGGMGNVYRARHVLMDKPVAVKLICEDLAHVRDVEKRFEREARSSSRLADPHCITVTDFGRTDDGTLFLVMELLEGQSLSDRIANEGALPVGEAVRISVQILKGLSHAHGQGVIHRDLKPENVMLVTHGDEEGFVKILDFGIAKLASGDDPRDNLTQSGVVFGTPRYLSPEQATGEAVDHRADLYAAGIILFEMLAGAPPFDGDSAVRIIGMQVSAPVPALAEAGAFPEGLQEVLDRALSKSPSDRYQSADDLVEALEALDLSAIPARPSPVERAVALARAARDAIAPLAARRSFRLGLAGAVSAILAAAILVGVLSGGGEGKGEGEEGEVDGPRAARAAELIGLAEDQIRNGLAGEAVISSKEALSLAPGHSRGLLVLGHAQYASGDRAGAMESYAACLAADPGLGADVRLGENLEEALDWAAARSGAAGLIARYRGEKGVSLLAGLASSALTPVEKRGAAREALVEAGHGEAVDWLASLTADFHDLKKCKQRREIIARMEETGDPRFLPLLEKHRPVTKRQPLGRTKTTNPCIGADVLRAIETLTEIKEGRAPGSAP